MPDLPRTVSENGEEDPERKLEEWFHALFHAYQHRLFQFFQGRGWSREDALDLTQKALLCVWRGLGDYRETGPVGAWVFRIAKNVHSSEKRVCHASKREGHEVPLDELTAELFDTATAGILEEIVQKEQRHALRYAVETLPPQQQRCMKMYIYHGLRLEEIGRALKISPATVKAHLFQARQHLKKELGAYFIDEDL